MYLNQLRRTREASLRFTSRNKYNPLLRPSSYLNALLECLSGNEMRLPANEKHSLLLFRYLTTAVPPHHPYAPPFQDDILGLLSPVGHQHYLKLSTSVVPTIYLTSLVKWDYVLLEKRKHYLCIPVLGFGLRAFFNGMLHGFCSTLYWNQEITLSICVIP